MTTFSMSSYLSTVAPDYAYTLDIDGQHVMPFTPYKNHELFYNDDGDPVTLTFDDNPKFEIAVTYDALTADNANIIMDLWLDSAKANGTENSFRWQHPKEAVIYTVNFVAIPSLKIFPHSYQGVDRVQLLVRGNYVP